MSTATLPPLADARECALSATLSGRNAYHCAQRFAYRSKDAQEAFDSYDASLRTCLGNASAAEQNLGVNHPDTYDLRTYQQGDATVSISLKDKGALQATYVFVRVSGAAQE